MVHQKSNTYKKYLESQQAIMTSLTNKKEFFKMGNDLFIKARYARIEKYKANLNLVINKYTNKLLRLENNLKKKIKSEENKFLRATSTSTSLEPHLAKINVAKANIKIQNAKSKLNNLKVKYKNRLLKFGKKEQIFINKYKKEFAINENNFNARIDLKIEKAQAFIKQQKTQDFVFINNLEIKLKGESEKIESTFIKAKANLENKIKSNLNLKRHYKQNLDTLELSKNKKLNKLFENKSIINNSSTFKNNLYSKYLAVTTAKNVWGCGKWLWKWLNQNKLIIAILLFAFFVGVLKPNFFTSENWFDNIIKLNISNGLLAVGMTLVILTGGIDLSVGSGLGLSGAIILLLFTSGIALPLAIIIGIISSMTLGLLIGLFVSYGRFQAFIVSLVGLLAFSGATKILLKGAPISIEKISFFDFLSNGTIGVFPVVMLFFILIILVVYFVLKFTRFGRYIYAVGSNENAAKVSGIKTKRIILSTFIISGFFVALAALVFISNVGSISPTTGAGLELDAIAAVVLGGTTLTGGKGGIGKTLIGWLVISILGNILVFLGIDSNYQLIFKGIVILIAIILDGNINFKNHTIRIYKKMRGI